MKIKALSSITCCRVSQKKQCLFLFGLCLFTLLFLSLHPFVNKSQNYCILVDDRDGPINIHQNILNSKLYPFFNDSDGSNLLTQGDWIAFAPHVFAYSAYVDETSVPAAIDTRYYIKVLSVVLPSYPVLKSSPIKLSCLLKYENGTVTSQPAFLELLPEHHNMCYKPAFIFCPVPSQVIPSQVSLTRNNSSQKWIKVQSALPTVSKSFTDVSICVRPLHGPYKSISQLAEFIGYYEAMGVSDFYFYKYFVSDQVMNFLSHISKANKVRINMLPWTLPNIDSYLLHAEGQLIFIQDCLLRLRSRSRYVMLLDLDEFLMPQEDVNISVALSQLSYDYPEAGSFSIQIVMFCEEYLPSTWPNEDIPLVTQVAKKRQETPWKHTYRSKFVAKPHRLNIGGIHQIWQNVYPFTTINVPSSKILLYHYRSCCGLLQPYFLELFEFSPLHSDGVVEDDRMSAVKDRINNSTTVSVIRGILRKSVNHV